MSVFESIITTMLGSTLLGIVIKVLCERRAEKSKIIANARKTIYKRIELPYRVRRRLSDGSEDAELRNHVHQVQEDCEYYRSLLYSISWCYGMRYDMYLDRVKKITSKPIKAAWKKKGNPSAEIEEEADILLDYAQLDKLARQFDKDTRNYMNLIRRMPLWVKSVLHNVRIRGYGDL